LNNVKGLTLKFNRFRISPKFNPFLHIEDCNGCQIDLIRNSIITYGNTDEASSGSSSSSSSSSGGESTSGSIDSPLIKVIDSEGLDVNIVNNDIVDLSEDEVPYSTAMIKETNDLYSNPYASGKLDTAIRTFDSGLHFDSFSLDTVNTFYIVGNYVSYKYNMYSFIRSGNYRTEIKKGWNVFRYL